MIWLVVWNIFYCSIIYGRILPIDFHIFQRGCFSTNQWSINIWEGRVVFYHRPSPGVSIKCGIPRRLLSGWLESHRLTSITGAFYAGNFREWSNPSLVMSSSQQPPATPSNPQQPPATHPFLTFSTSNITTTKSPSMALVESPRSRGKTHGLLL